MSLLFRSRGFQEKSHPRRQQIYEGSEKILYAGPEADTCVLYFKDYSRHVPGQLIAGKGVLNNRISDLFMRRLGDIGVATHYLRQLNMREQLVRAAEIVPLQVSVHNVATGSFATRLGLEDNYRLSRPIIEYRFKSKELSYPLISPSHALALGWAEEDEIDDIASMVQRINDFLQGQFSAVGIHLSSFQVEFGRLYLMDFLEGSQLVLIDEISPDTCSLLDAETKDPLDASVIVQNPEQASHVYQEVARRLGILDAI